MSDTMEPTRESLARAAFAQLAAHERREHQRFGRGRPRPRLLPPGNWSVQAILAIEFAINGQQLSAIETDWQRNRRLMSEE